MPDESCRNCGGKLLDHTKCSQCMKLTSMICKDCAHCTMEQYHSVCMYKTNIVSTIKSDNYLVALA